MAWRERRGDAQARWKKKPECLKQEEKKGKKHPDHLPCCLPAGAPQKRVTSKNGARTLKGSSRAERPRDLHLLLGFIWPQISPLAAASVKELPDKETPLSHQEQTSMPRRVSGAVTKPGAMGPCGSTQGGGLPQASRNDELQSSRDLSHPLGSCRLPQPEGNLS